MKKILLLSVLALVLFSCGANKNTAANLKPMYEVLLQQNDGGGNINFYEILSEPNEIKMLLHDEKLKGKINTADVQQSNFVILNMGQKPTSGYSITVDSVIETNENIIIKVREINPDPNAMVMQVITYPYTVVKINSKKEILIK